MKAAPWLFVLLWSGGFTAVAIALPYTEPLTLQVLRYAAVVLLLLPPVLLLRPAWPNARGLRHLARMGLVIQFSYFACTNLALSWGISPGGLALIVALQPILVALLFRTLDAFRIFDNIYVLTGGSNKTASVSILGYDNLFKAFNLGLGSAISVLVFATVAVIAFIYIKLFGASAPGADNEVR